MQALLPPKSPSYNTIATRFGLAGIRAAMLPTGMFYGGLAFDVPALSQVAQWLLLLTPGLLFAVSVRSTIRSIRQDGVSLIHPFRRFPFWGCALAYPVGVFFSVLAINLTSGPVAVRLGSHTATVIAAGVVSTMAWTMSFRFYWSLFVAMQLLGVLSFMPLWAPMRITHLGRIIGALGWRTITLHGPAYLAGLQIMLAIVLGVWLLRAYRSRPVACYPGA